MKSRDILFSSLFVVFYLVLFFSVEAQVKSSRGTLGYTFEEKSEMHGLREIRFYNEGTRCTCFMI